MSAPDLDSFRIRLAALVADARRYLEEGRAAATQGAKPEEFTKDRLITPLLEALGYRPDCRSLEGKIPSSLARTTHWADYFLLPDPRKRPWCMVEAKSLFKPGIWQLSDDKTQVIDYLKDYQQEVGRQRDPIMLHWLVLTNFREFHFIRHSDDEPFWSLKLDELEANADALFDRLARGEAHRNRLDEFYYEKERANLTPRFLTDLKGWRLLLANGIREKQPQLDLLDVRRFSQQLLNRLLFTRLLEAYGQEAFNSLTTTFEHWRSTFDAMPFSEYLSVSRRHTTWLRYNTELFRKGAVDDLVIDGRWFEPIVRRDGVLDSKARAIVGGSFAGRSLYNYDFTTLSQDILGKAYEQFLAHELAEAGKGWVKILENQATRKREGIFYTPEFVVDHIVSQTLGPRVAACLQDAIQFLADKEPGKAQAAARKILDIRVVDPSCGSGSFLIGALAFLVDSLERFNDVARKAAAVEAARASLMDAETSAPNTIPDVVERVLVHCIHGVDLDGEAVDLAKLSLWSQLLRANKGRYGRSGDAHGHLPVLTLNIRQGNSLIQPPVEPGEFDSERMRAADLARTVQDLRLPDEERLAAAQEMEALVAQLKVATRARLPLAQDLPTDPAVRLRRTPFAWQLDFARVFDPRLAEAQRGFDVVLGNPPYFNVDATWGKGAAELTHLKVNYPDVYTDKTDVLFYFFRRGYDLLKDGGDLAFITSRAYLQGDKAQKLREFMRTRTRIRQILDFLGQRVFQAGIAVAVTWWQKQTPQANDMLDARFVLQLDQAVEHKFEVFDDAILGVSIPQSSLVGNRWNSLSPFRDLFAMIDGPHADLRRHPAIDVVEQGVQTGDNGVFLVPPEVQLDSPCLRQHVSNSGIRCFGLNPGMDRLLYIESDSEFEMLQPDVQRYLQQHRAALESRAAFKEGSCRWYSLQRSRRKDGHHHFRPKILVSYRADRSRFAVDEGGALAGLTDTTAIFCKHDNLATLHTLCALLNSLPLEFRFRALGGLGKLTGRGMFEYFENQIADLPIPDFAAPENAAPLADLAAHSRALHALFADRLKVVEAWREVVEGVLTRPMVPLANYCDLAHPTYGRIVHASSPHAAFAGEIVALRVETPASDTLLLRGLVTDPDDDDAPRTWLPVAHLRVTHTGVRRLLLARLVDLTEFDDKFRNRRSLGKGDSVLDVALQAVTVPQFDARDAARNLAVVEQLGEEVAARVGRCDIDGILLAWQDHRRAVDDVALGLYGVTEHRALMQEALRVVL